MADISVVFSCSLVIEPVPIDQSDPTWLLPDLPFSNQIQHYPTKPNCAGSFFGEMSVLFDQRRTATVQAVTFCDLFTLTQRDLYTLLDSFPGFAEKMRELALARCATFYPDLMSTLELGDEEEEMIARQQQASPGNDNDDFSKDDDSPAQLQTREAASTMSPAKRQRQVTTITSATGTLTKQNSVGRARTMMATSGEPCGKVFAHSPPGVHSFALALSPSLSLSTSGQSPNRR